MGWFGALQRTYIDLYKAEEASRSGYSAVHEAVERICKKHNIKLPKIYIGQSDAMQKEGAFICASRDCIFISPEAPGFFGTHSPANHISKEFEAVLGHELSHVNGGLLEVVAKRGWTFALPAILVAGMFFHDRAAKQAHDGSVHAMVAHLQQMSPEATHDAILKDALDKGLLKPEEVVHAADKRQLAIDLTGAGRQSVIDTLMKPKYLAAAGGGVLGGILANGAASRAFERKADRFGALVAGNQAMIDSLESVRNSPMFGGGTAREKHIFSGISSLFKEHPALENRIGALR